MRIALYAHKWHYLDNYKPFIDELEARGVGFDIILIYPRDDSYKKYKSQYGDRLKELYYERWGEYFYQPKYVPIFLRNILKVLFFKNKLEKFFKSQKYHALVTSDDRALMHCVVLYAAKRAGIKTVLYPAETLLRLKDLLADKFSKSPRPTLKRNLISKLTRAMFPENFIKYKNTHIYRYHPREVLELFFLKKMFSKNPWMAGGNSATDLVAVSSKIQKEENCANGIEENKIHVVGFPPHDNMRFNPINKGDIGIKDKKIFLIFGAHWRSSPLYENDSAQLSSELNNVLAAIVSVLENKYTIIFKTHPQMDLAQQKEDIKKDIRDKIVFIKNEYSGYELIPVSDAIFNFMSSTTIAACATDSPIFCYHLFKKTTSIEEWSKIYCSTVNVANSNELRQALLDMRANKLLNGRLKELRMLDRNKYGKFDGHNTRRFMRLIEGS